MNVHPRFLSSNEIMEFLGGDEDNTLQTLNLRLGLPRQDPSEIVYNSCCKFLPRLHNIVLPGLEHLGEWGRSTELQVNGDSLFDYSRSLELPNGVPYESVDDPTGYTLQLKSIEPLNTDGKRVWCYVERTIFFHLDEPYASLDVVMMATSPSASIIRDQAEGPLDGLAFAVTNSGKTRTITYDKDAEDEEFESIFKEHFL
jgi:hypothetical protein